MSVVRSLSIGRSGVTYAVHVGRRVVWRRTCSSEQGDARREQLAVARAQAERLDGRTCIRPQYRARMNALES